MWGPLSLQVGLGQACCCPSLVMDTAGNARYPIPASPGLTCEVFKLPKPANIFLENAVLDYFCVVLLFLLCIPGERDVPAPSLHPPGFLQRP